MKAKSCSAAAREPALAVQLQAVHLEEHRPTGDEAEAVVVVEVLEREVVAPPAAVERVTSSPLHLSSTRRVSSSVKKGVSGHSARDSGLPEKSRLAWLRLTLLILSHFSMANYGGEVDVRARERMGREPNVSCEEIRMERSDERQTRRIDR